jgi:hypothetical protein
MLKALREFIVRLLLRDSPKGVMTTLPNKDLVDLNVQKTAEFLMRNGVDPNSLKNANQVENAINMIENRSNVQQGIKSTQTAKVFDMEGKEIPKGSKIMGGKAIDDDLPPPGSRGGKDDIAAPVQSSEETIKNMIEAENKKNIAKMRNRKMVKDAIDNMSPGFVKGDRKYNAQLVAEDLADKKFGKEFYDLDQRQQIDLYDEALKGLSEDFAQGGRAGFKIGSIDKARRAFLKAAAGVTGGIAALKTGLLNIGKGADTVKNLPPIKTPVTKLEGTTTQMPEWFPSFINKFRDEGKAKDVFKTKKVEVSKAEYDQAFKEGKGERYFSDVARTPEYKANNPDHMDYYKRVDTDERIYTTYTNDKVPGVRVDDMDGNVDVMFENDYSQPVSLNYTAPGKKGPETGRADIFVQGEAKLEPKPKGEFVANDVEVYATDPDGGSEAVDVIADTVDDMLEGKTRQMEEYVTGKKTKLSKGEGRVIEAEIRAEQAADAAAEAAADAADEFSSGGIARMLGE